jgi:hypothetical protein
MAKPPIVAKGAGTAKKARAKAKPALPGTAAKRTRAPKVPGASEVPIRILPLSAKESVASDEKVAWPMEAVIESTIRDTQQPRRRTARTAPSAAIDSGVRNLDEEKLLADSADHQARGVSLGQVLLAMQAEAAAVNAIALSQDAGQPSFAISQIKFDLSFVVTDISDGKVGIAISGERFEKAPKEQIQRLNLAMIDPNFVLIRPDEPGGGS